MYMDEAGAIERFQQSWRDAEKELEQRIDEDGVIYLVPLLMLVQRMKAAGEDRCLRLQTMNKKLLFSRSARIQFRNTQLYLDLELMENNFVVTLRDLDKMHRQFTLKDLDDERFTVLLQTVKDLDID